MLRSSVRLGAVAAILFFASFLTARPSWAQAATTQKSGKNMPPADAVKRGRAQFSQSCSFCHGANATGGAEGPNLMRSSVVRHDSGGDLIGKVIREGRPNGGMPPIPL